MKTTRMLLTAATLCAGLLSFASGSAQADTTTLQPGPGQGKDIWTTSVYSYAPGGGGPGGGLDNDILRVGGWADYYYSLLQFDLTVAPQQATSAILRLYNGDGVGAGGTPMLLDRITQFWDWRTQGTGKDRLRLWWADKPPTVQWQATLLPTPAKNAFYDIDITSLYNAWQSGQYPNYGLQLRPTLTNNNWNQFYSSDYLGNPLQRPQLVVTSSVPPPPPAPTGLWGTPNGAQVLLGWETSSKAVDGWKVYVKTAQSLDNFGLVATNLPVKITTAAVPKDAAGTALQPGTTYEFAITSVANGQESQFSTPVQVRLGSGSLPKPRNPVLFLHGFSGSAARTWSYLRDSLISAGWTFGGELTRVGGQLSITGASDPTGGDFFLANFRAFDSVDCASPFCGFGHISTQGEEIPGFLDMIKQRFLGSNIQFQLFAHSNGGLAARSYITSQQFPLRSDVSHLAIYGTPNLGAALLDLTTWANDTEFTFCRAASNAADAAGAISGPGKYLFDRLMDDAGILVLQGLVPAAFDAQTNSAFLLDLKSRPVPTNIKYSILVGSPPTIQQAAAAAQTIAVSLGCVNLSGILGDLKDSDGLVTRSSQFGLDSGGAIFPRGPGRTSIATQHWHTEETSDVPNILQALGGSFAITIHSPVTIEVTSPDGRLITKFFNEIPGAIYKEFLDENNHDIGQVLIPFATEGDYSIRVVPKPGASPTDTYTIDVTQGNVMTIVAKNQQISDIPTTGFSVQIVNQPPVANAGQNQTVRLGSLVRFNGMGSSDLDYWPEPLSYTWHEVSGPVAVSLTGAATATPSFAPSQKGKYIFGLIVNDGQASSPEATVSVAVPALGDIDADGDVDSNDLATITTVLNQAANGPNDLRDIDGDGKITALDSRKLVTLCTRPRCATR